MPGSGVRANNISKILTDTGVKEIHSSARKNYPSAMLFSPASMQEQMMFTGVDEEEIKAMKSNCLVK
jgi:copper homeostasis protein CutC